MNDVLAIKSLIEDQGDAWLKYKAEAETKMAELQAQVDDLGKRTRPGSDVGGKADGAAGVTRELGEALRKALATGDDLELKGLSSTESPDGGYLVVPQLDSAIMKIRGTVSPFSTLARVVTLTEGSELLIPQSRGTLPAGWVAEQASRPETASPEIGQARIPLHEGYCMPGATQRLLDDSHWDVGALLTEMIGHGLATIEDAAFHSGNGITKPRGFLTYDTAATADSSRAWGTIQHVATGASGGFHTTKADPLFDVVASLRPQYRAGAVWLLNQTTLAAVRKLKESASGQYIYQPGLISGQPDRLLGMPLIIDETMPDISAGSLSIALGDFRQAYCIVDRPGVRLLRDPFTVKGRTLFYAYRRTGGAVVNSEALKFLKFSAS